MIFTSDNVTGAAPEILEALTRAMTSGAMPSYGADPVTAGLERRLADLFETEVAVFPVATGSAANSLALATLTPPYGAVYCHHEAHINTDECGAPEAFTGGAKLIGLPGEGGKIAAATLEAALARAPFGFVHAVQPTVLSLTQATEAGTIYTPAEVAALSAIARERGLAVHMDGARFANAVARLGCSPAELTWKAGVDVLSFGATKNGALAAEAVVFFGGDATGGAGANGVAPLKERAREFGYRRKRGGHLFSKMRVISAQLDAYVADGLWLRLAGHANAMADRLAAGLARVPGTSLRDPVQANEIFVSLPEPVTAGLLEKGYQFYRWDGPVVRLVTSWETRPEAVDALVADALALAGRA
ncbi:threonine aldolase family protein [Arenibaculum pallidiluteum]|uniref:threonine aldolase family protein n=1 Tax=Arenibaculum pallidiluteum TaxID=2812559 RepID=UPI001A978D9E|nr:low specificity L-threonine aldolase [Arenibaculum pallidiluteum]